MGHTTPTSVLRSRVDRARAVMAERGIDTLLVSVGSDLPYLAGYEAMPEGSEKRAFRKMNREALFAAFSARK